MRNHVSPALTGAGIRRRSEGSPVPHPRTTSFARHLARPLATLVLLFVLAACQSDSTNEAPTVDPDVATFGTATFDNAQFE